MPEIAEAVRTLEREMREIFGNRMLSLVVYGIHVREASRRHNHGQHGHHDHNEHSMPGVHTLVIVDAVTANDLRACSMRMPGWHDARLATPLLLGADELARSLDVFPFELNAILADHLVVSGTNPFDGLHVDQADLRRACEVQARGHLLHLRQAFMETRGRAD